MVRQIILVLGLVVGVIAGPRSAIVFKDELLRPKERKESEVLSVINTTRFTAFFNCKGEGVVSLHSEDVYNGIIIKDYLHIDIAPFNAYVNFTTTNIKKIRFHLVEHSEEGSAECFLRLVYN